MREIARMIVVLSLISAVSGLLLAAVKTATRERIEEQELFYVKGPALEAVLPAHDNDPIKDRKRVSLPGGVELLVFPARTGGALTAVAFETSAQGYGGPYGLMVGFAANAEQLTGVAVTTHKETPGVGTRTMQPAFTRQFRDHPFSGLALKSAGGTIDAVSGATVSSTAAAAAAGQALALFTSGRPAILGAFQ